MLYEEMGVRPSSVDSQHPACLPDVSLYRQSLLQPLYLIVLKFLVQLAEYGSNLCDAVQTGVTGLRRSEKARSLSA